MKVAVAPAANVPGNGGCSWWHHQYANTNTAINRRRQRIKASRWTAVRILITRTRLTARGNQIGLSITSVRLSANGATSSQSSVRAREHVVGNTWPLPLVAASQHTSDNTSPFWVSADNQLVDEGVLYDAAHTYKLHDRVQLAVWAHYYHWSVLSQGKYENILHVKYNTWCCDVCCDSVLVWTSLKPASTRYHRYQRARFRSPPPPSPS